MGLLDELSSIIVTPAPGTSGGGGGGGDPTNLNSVEAPTTVTITSSTGTNAVIPAADAVNAGVFLPTEKDKLTNIAIGATANSTDAFLLDRANHTGTQAQSTIVGLATTLGLKADLVDGKVPANQLPSFVDDVLEFADFASLPVTGESSKIYVTLDTNLTYRWSGSAYVQISESLALGETALTAYRGDRGKIAYDHSQLTSGNPHSVTKADVGLGDVVNADTTTTANINDSLDKRFVTDADATKLDGIEPGAEANIEHGLISGGVLTVNGGDNSRFDISDGTGLIVDQYTDPLNPVRYEISWTGLTAQVVTNLATSDKTYVLIDNTGAVVQLTTFPTEAERRDNILLGQLGHSNNTSIGGVIFDPDIASSPISQLRDIATGIGPINQGNVISPNGANLQLNKSAGSIIKLGANYGVDPKAPTEVAIAGASAFSWRYRTQTGAGATASLIDPNNYDNAGTITALAANKYTNQRVFLATNGNVVIQYGQIVYSSFSAAVTGVQEDIANFVRFPNLDDNFVLIAVITLARGATDLSNSSQAKFFKPSKFGETVGAVAGTSVTNLQQAYGNSPDPEILITNPLSFKANSGSDANNVIEVQNGASSVTFAVTGSGAVTTSSLTVGGNTISGTNSGDQNIFQTILVSGQPNIVANATSTSLTFIAGTNISLTTDNTAKTVTINSAGGGGGISDGDTLVTGLTFPATGLRVLDSDASHDIILSTASNLTGDRRLDFNISDADTTLTINGVTAVGGTNTGDITLDQNGFSFVSLAGQALTLQAIAQSAVTNLTADLAVKADLVGGVVPANQLPSFVDDVLEFADFASLPVTGESGKIYVTLDDNLTYRWSGSAYVQISESLALGETALTAYRGDRGKIAYDHSQITSGNPHGTTKADVGLGNVVNVDTTTTANITDSLDKRFVTDAELTVLGNTSGINTGDLTPVIVNNAASPYNAADKQIIGALTSTGAITIDLPASGGNAVIFVKDKDFQANNTTKIITITPNGTDTINGQSLITLTTPGAYMGLAIAAGQTDWDMIFFSDNTDEEGLGYNFLINGSQAINQKGSGSTTVVAGAAKVYLLDMWYSYATGGNVTWEQVALAANNYRSQYTGGAGNTKIEHGQRLEALDTKELDGSNVTISFKTSNTLLTEIKYQINYANTINAFGTKASPTVTPIASGTVTGISATEGTYSFQVAIPSAATTGLEIIFFVENQTSGTWQIGDFKMELGDVATSFTHHRNELEKCLKTVEFVDVVLVGYGLASSSVGMFQNCRVPKRALPAATLTQDGVITSNLNVGALSFEVYRNGIFVYRTTPATGAFRFHEQYLLENNL